jgi:hypothetical protein
VEIPETWRRSLLNLPEGTFFELARNYLGALKGPLNRRRLIEELSAYLCRPEVQRGIEESLDELDCRIIAAVRVMESPSRRRLLAFFKEDPRKIRLRLFNLQDRLILYQEDSPDPLYQTAPQLEALFSRAFPDSRPLFCGRRGSAAPGDLWLNESFLAALFSYGLHDRAHGRQDRRPLKKILAETEALFPALSSRERREGVEAFQKQANLGGGDQGDWNFPRWEALAGMPRRRLLIHLWSSFLFGFEAFPEGESFLEALIRYLPPGMIFSEEALLVLIRLLSPVPEGPSPAALEESPHGEGSPDEKTLLDRLRLLNLLTPAAEEAPPPARPFYGLNPALACLDAPDPGGEDNSGPVVQPTGDIMVMPGLPFALQFRLAHFCRIRRVEKTAAYLLDRDSLCRGLARGLTLGEIKTLLSAAGPLPQSLDFLLDQWEEQFRSLRLIEGLIVKMSPGRARLMENSPGFAGGILETLGPGVYLMDLRERKTWEKALLGSGFFTLPEVESFLSGENPEPGPGAEKPEFRGTSEPAFPVRGLRLPPALENKPPAPSPESPSAPARLRSALEAGAFSSEDREELGNRIDKKLILFEDQLSPEILSKEAREVRGLDYKGKVRFIEEALNSRGCYLEIHWLAGGDPPPETPGAPLEGRLQTDRIFPRRLIKEGGELILAGEQFENPGPQEYRIRVRKISRLLKKKLLYFFPADFF